MSLTTKLRSCSALFGRSSVSRCGPSRDQRKRCLRIFQLILVTAGAAFAQIDLGGEWAATFHEDLQHRGGVRLGDYTGVPLQESGWRKAQSWDESARST